MKRKQANPNSDLYIHLKFGCGDPSMEQFSSNLLPDTISTSDISGPSLWGGPKKWQR